MTTFLYQLDGILFQDLAPKKRTDLIIYCKVFCELRNCRILWLAVYHTNENLSLNQNIVESYVVVVRRCTQASIIQVSR